MKVGFLILVSLLSIGSISCERKPVEYNSLSVTENMQAEKISSDTIFSIEGHELEIRLPKNGAKGNLLVLPGWGFLRTRWCNETDLCSLALEAGLRVILPEMGKSVYQSENYPQTRQDWLKYPTRNWVTAMMIPFLQQHGILSMGDDNYIIGLSTGARGVVLVCLDNPDLFKAAAALSGDLDQTLMKEDNLMKGVYGKFEEHKERWEGKDNPTTRVAEWRTPLYLGHGTKDHVVPVAQTKHFYEKLKEARPEVEVVLNLPDAGHDFNYWGAEVKPVLEFFSKQK